MTHGDRQFSAVDFNQIPFIESVFEILTEHPLVSNDSGDVPYGRFYYNSTAKTAYVKTPDGWKSMPGAQKKSFKIGDGINNVFVIQHGMGTRDLTITVRLTDSPYSVVNIDADFTDENTVTITCDEVNPLDVNYLTVILVG